MTAEPTDVGPLYGGDQLIDEADRRLVFDLLVAARAVQRLSDQEYQWRVQRTQAARFFDDLVPITRDLMA